MNRKITNVKPVFKIFKEGEKIPSCAENPKCNSELLVHEFLKISNKRLKELDSKQIHRENKTKITLYACFLSVSDIENIKQRFQAKVYIEAQWEDDSIIETSFDPKKYWVPDLYIENAIGAPKQDIKYKLVKKNGKTNVIEMLIVSGTFYETLELNDFPIGNTICITKR